MNLKAQVSLEIVLVLIGVLICAAIVGVMIIGGSGSIGKAFETNLANLKLGENTGFSYTLSFFPEKAKEGYIDKAVSANYYGAEMLVGARNLLEGISFQRGGGIPGNEGIVIPAADVNVFRAYISFDTSDLKGKEILEANLKFYKRTTKTDSALDLRKIEIREKNNAISNPLDAGNWQNFKGSSIASLEFGAPEGWQEIPINPEKINTKGFTDFELRAEFEALENGEYYWSIYSSEAYYSGFQPYLEVKIAQPVK